MLTLRGIQAIVLRQLARIGKNCARERIRPTARRTRQMCANRWAVLIAGGRASGCGRRSCGSRARRIAVLRVFCIWCGGFELRTGIIVTVQNKCKSATLLLLCSSHSNHHHSLLYGWLQFQFSNSGRDTFSEPYELVAQNFSNPSALAGNCGQMTAAFAKWELPISATMAARRRARTTLRPGLSERAITLNESASSVWGCCNCVWLGFPHETSFYTDNLGFVHTVQM